METLNWKHTEHGLYMAEANGYIMYASTTGLWNIQGPALGNRPITDYADSMDDAFRTVTRTYLELAGLPYYA